MITKFRLTLFAVLLVSLLLPITTDAGHSFDEPDYYQIETKDGSVILGKLISEDDDHLIIYSDTFGEVRVLKENIKRKTRMEPGRIRNGEHWIENPLGTRYLATPSAIGQRRGTGYYQNTWVLFNTLNRGITDNISIGAGMVPLFFLGGDSMPVWIFPKFSFPIQSDMMHVATGAMLGAATGEGDPFGYVYSVFTYGSRDNNVSFGGGYGFSGGDWSDNLFFNVSAMLRMDRIVYFVTDNYIFPGDEVPVLASIAFRRTTQRFAVDFGLVRPIFRSEIGINNFIGIPWLGLSFIFGDQ